MSASEIDRLEIEIESSARSAIGELDQLSSKLKNVGKVLGNVLKKNSLSSMISPSDTQKIGKEMANNLIKGFNLDKAGSAEVKKQVRSLSREIANGFAKEGKSFDWGAPAEKLASILKESGGIADEVTADYQRLYEAIKAIGKIKINPIDAKSLGDAYKNRSGLFRQKFSQREGIPLDTIYGELSGQFKGILPDAAAVGTVEDQFHALNDALSYYYKLRDSGLSKPEGFEENVYASIVNEVKELTSALEKAKDASRNVKSVDVDADTDRAIDNTADAVSELADSMEKFLGTGATPSEIGKIATNLKKFEQIDAGKIKEVAGSIKELGNSFSFLNKIDGSASEILAAVREAKKLGTGTSLGKAINDVWKPQDMSTLKITRADDSVDNDYDGPLRNPITLSEEPSYNADAMTAVFGEATSKISDYADAIKEFGKQAGIVLNELGNKPVSLDTKSFEAQIRNIKSQMQSLRSEGLGPGDEQYDTFSKQMAVLKEQKAYYEKYFKELAKLSVASEKAIGGEGGAARLTAEEMEELAKEKAGASLQNKKLGTNAKETGSYLSKEASRTKALSQAFKKMSKGYNNVLKTVSKPIISGFKNLTRAISDSQKQYNKGFSVPRMIGMSVLYSTVFGTISSINQAIVDGSNNLVQYSNTYNQSISSIVSALTYLKNAWAAAFAPIVNVVAPYLQSFINMIASALNAIGRFFAALTGKGFAVQAKKVYQDYGASLADTGSGAGDAADGLKDAQKAAEEYQKTILGFDELNVLNKPDEDKGAGGSGGSGGSGNGGGIGELLPADMFETVKVEGPIADFAKRIREAFLNEDWEGLGKVLADGINSVFQKVDDAIKWDNVGGKITKAVNAITTTFNSLVDNINWDLIGRTFGDGINTIVNTLNLLITGIDWNNLGKSFATGVMSMFHTVNWNNLGNLIGNYFMIAWNIAKGFVLNLDYATIGQAFGNAVNGIFESVDFTTIGTVLYTGFNGLMDIVRNFALTVNWDAIAQNIYNGLNTMIHGIDWAAAGESLSLLVTSLLGTFKTVAQNTDWEGLGRGIGEMLSNIDWLGIFTGVIEIISEILGGLIKGLGETTAGKVLLAIGTVAAVFKGVQIVTAAKSAIDKVLSTWGFLPKGIESKTPLISSAVSKIKPVLSKIGGFAKTATSTAITKIGELAKGIVGKIPSIGSAIGKVGSKLMTLVPKAASMVIGAVGKLGGLVAAIGPAGWIAIGIGAGVVAIIANWDKVKEAAGVVKDWVVEKWGQLKEKTSEIWGNIKDFVGKTWDDLKSWASEKFNNIKESVSNAWENTKKKTSEVWNSVKETAGNIWDGMKETAGNVFSDIKSNVSSAWEGAKNLTSSAWNGISSWVSRIWSGMDTDARSSFDNIDHTISNSSSSSSNTVSREWGRVRDTLRDVFNGMQVDAANGIDSIAREFENLSWKISNSIGSLYWAGRDAAQSFADGFQSVYIPTPHMYVSSWNYHDLGNGGSMATPNFDVQWYKSGGFFNKASVIGVGESGEEAVVPFTNAAAMKRLASAITAQMPGTLNTGKSVAINNRKIEEAIASAGKMAIRAAMNTTKMLMDEFADLLMEIYLQTNNEGNDELPYIINAELRTEDNEVLARAVERGKARRDYRYNRTKK